MSKNKGGRPPKYGKPMTVTTIRLPPSWIAQLKEEFGSLQEGIESLVNAYVESAEASSGDRPNAS